MPTLWTIGHSTRDWQAFLGMLAEAGIRTLADVRRFAGSRRHPQFSGETMRAALAEAGVRRQLVCASATAGLRKRQAGL
ncbi:DUF488 family protein [Vulcaniibacterium tengchongense]|uniref:Uncharacterized protein DUF488 n=1 Tax=Vulcaniibacterium tengchongense TaxID=1273429 RepID=A0A3N4VXK8_9GAMM|nr:DUF488 family protein [Vulcaniibacterium tengchongense]RPE81857.1 uncharacterized protein DUF488 [Vulcaniibacterium tengchongense]